MTEKVPIHFAFSHNLVSVRVSGNPCVDLCVGLLYTGSFGGASGSSLSAVGTTHYNECPACHRFSKDAVIELSELPGGTAVTADGRSSEHM